MKRNDLTQQAFDQMTDLKRAMHSHFLHSFERFGLSLVQLELLKKIQRQQPLSAKQLADMMQLTPGAISQFLEGLDQADCIMRTPNPQDRRVVLVSLSRTGTRKLEEYEKLRKRLFTDAFAVFSDDELKQWLHIQQKLINWLESTTSTK
jgi:DNA-binding MarR family transcriptional regulator